MRGCRVIVMAKAPVPGFAKTRLIPALGAERAAALAGRLLEHAVSQALSAGLGPVELCVTPDTEHPVFAALAAQGRVALTRQGDGDLGCRMARALDRALADGPVVLTGTDAPALTAARLREAAGALQSADAVFVPALDGGYALVGLARAIPGLFDRIDWSTAAVMAQTRARLAAAGSRAVELSPVADIDEPADLAHLVPFGADFADALHEDRPAPGRLCPIDYRYGPGALATTSAERCDTLYVVGGLYGNEAALDAVEALVAREPGTVRVAFNGDFHWFDADPAVFDRIARRVAGYDAMRGNVETELSRPVQPGEAAGAGCGCAYPAWVDQTVVERSNRILARLRSVAAADPARRQALARLPMWLRYSVGDARIAVVHGDAESLAGWGFAQEHLDEPAHRRRVRGWFDAARADVFASTHTCLPVALSWSGEAGAGPKHLINNGAAGMPNFAGHREGLVTRIGRHPYDGPGRRFGIAGDGLHIDAIAVAYDQVAWTHRFLRDWPPGSDAHSGYWSRIVDGPAYDPQRAVRHAD